MGGGVVEFIFIGVSYVGGGVVGGIFTGVS